MQSMDKPLFCLLRACYPVNGTEIIDHTRKTSVPIADSKVRLRIRKSDTVTDPKVYASFVELL